MTEQHQPRPNQGLIARLSFGRDLASLLAYCLAIGPALFLRTHIGVRFLSASQLIASFILLNLIALAAGEASPLFATYIGCFFILALAHRLATAVHTRNGNAPHTYWPGDSYRVWLWLGISPELLPFVDSSLWIALSLFVYPFDGPFGIYIALSGFALFTTHITSFIYYRHKRRDINDSLITADFSAKFCERDAADERSSTTVPLAELDDADGAS